MTQEGGPCEQNQLRDRKQRGTMNSAPSPRASIPLAPPACPCCTKGLSLTTDLRRLWPLCQPGFPCDLSR